MKNDQLVSFNLRPVESSSSHRQVEGCYETEAKAFKRAVEILVSQSPPCPSNQYKSYAFARFLSLVLHLFPAVPINHFEDFQDSIIFCTQLCRAKHMAMYCYVLMRPTFPQPAVSLAPSCQNRLMFKLTRSPFARLYRRKSSAGSDYRNTFQFRICSTKHQLSYLRKGLELFRSRCAPKGFRAGLTSTMVSACT